MTTNAKPLIAYDNALAGADADVTASSEAAGYPAANLSDWRTYTRWKGSRESQEAQHIVQDTNDNLNWSFGTSTYRNIAQTFTLDEQVTIDKYKMKLASQGTPTDHVEAALYTTSGDPAKPFELIQTSDNQVDPAGTKTEYTFEFNQELEPGVYAVVVYRTGDLDDANYYQGFQCGTNAYEDGRACREEYDSGWEWVTSTSRDFWFDIQYNQAAYEWIKLDAGEGGTVTASCLGISGHDLKTSGAITVTFKYSDDGITWTNVMDPISIADDKTIFKTFGELSKRFFMLRIDAGYEETPSIGVLFVGGYFQFPSWCSGSFDPDEQEKMFEAGYSRDGRLLGMTEDYVKRSISISFELLSFSFVDDYWKPFWNNHVPRPFFFGWDVTNHADEVYLVAFDKAALKIPYGANSRSIKGLRLIGLGE